MPVSPDTTFVFIPGGSSNALHWGPLSNELALLGRRSYAIDLPGHGVHAQRPAAYYRDPHDIAALAAAPSPMKGVTLRDAVEHVVGVVRGLAAHGPVVLVANSLGGATLSAVGNAAPELVDRLVYLSALCYSDVRTLETGWPEDAQSLLHVATDPLMVGDVASQGFARINWRSAHADPERFAQLKEAMMADSTDDQFRALIDTMDPDESYEVLAPECVVRADAWGRVPHTYVRLTRDQGIPLGVQDRMIAEADAVTPDNPFDVRSLDASHVGYFSRPREFAQLLVSL